jgi:hypothetical protein
MSDKQAKMVQAVREYAVEHYTENGWDYVVEAFTDEEILEKLMQAHYINNRQKPEPLPTTPKQAIKHMEWHARLLNEHRADIEATKF